MCRKVLRSEGLLERLLYNVLRDYYRGDPMLKEEVEGIVDLVLIETIELLGEAWIW